MFIFLIYICRHGCDTVIVSRRQDKLKQSADLLMKATGRKCVPIQMDVRKVFHYYLNHVSNVMVSILASTGASSVVDRCFNH